jgi:hypothetical protein
MFFMNFTQLLLDATTVAEKTGCAVVALSEPIFSGARHMILLAPANFWDKGEVLGPDSWYNTDYPDELPDLWDETSQILFYQDLDEFAEAANDVYNDGLETRKPVFQNIVATYHSPDTTNQVSSLLNSLIIDRQFIENILRAAKKYNESDLPKIRAARNEIDAEIATNERRSAADVAAALGISEVDMWKMVKNGQIIVKQKVK